MRLVSDSLNWEQMDGKSDLEKKLNSYLSYSFIGRESVPSNELLTYAQKISSLKSITAEDSITELLWHSFGNNGPMDNSAAAKRIRDIALGALAILIVEKKGG